MIFRRRRADVGVYEDPPIRPLAPVERVVEDGLLVSSAAARLAVKNHIIVAALRRNEDYDLGELMEFARAELLRLADENDETAERLDRAYSLVNQPPTPPVESPRKSQSREDHRRRPGIHRLLAVALRDEAERDDRVETLVSQARDSASEEIRSAVASRLLAQHFEVDPDYEAEREQRIADFIALNLRESHPPTP